MNFSLGSLVQRNIVPITILNKGQRKKIVKGFNWIAALGPIQVGFCGFARLHYTPLWERYCA